MSDSFEILIDPQKVAEVILDLSLIDGVLVQIPVNENLPSPSDQKNHGAYKLDFAQLAPIIISVTGLLTSLITLAAAIIKFKSETEETKMSSDEKPLKETVIVINQQIISLSNFSDAEALAAYLQKNLEK